MTDEPSKVNWPTKTVGWIGEAGRVGRALAPAADLLRSVGWGAYRRQRRFDSMAGAWTSRVRRQVYRSIWEDAAAAAGADCQELSGDFLLISLDGRQTVVWYHTVMLDFGLSLQLAADKVAVHVLLEQMGLPMATHMEVDAGNRSAACAFVSSVGAPCVVKPARSTSGGEGVTCGVVSPAEVERARVWARRWDSHLLIERQAQGDEYRLLFLDGELLDVVRRRPPEVVGDGQSPIGELIATENRRREESGGRLGTSYLHVDLDCLLTLDRAGLSLASVPAQGQIVRVKTAVNQNGAAQNETVSPDAIGPALIADAAAAARAVDLRFAGVEVMTPDPSRSLAEAGGLVVEVNGTPGLQYHYLVAEPEKATRVARPVLTALLDTKRTRLFRESNYR
ncbi:MAG: hypothetical protein JO337_03200 [Acidimicrobiales bacterium]|nr:hypothetical protein [Acidimicrobiales bacterium]